MAAEPNPNSNTDLTKGLLGLLKEIGYFPYVIFCLGLLLAVALRMIPAESTMEISQWLKLLAHILVVSGILAALMKIFGHYFSKRPARGMIDGLGAGFVAGIIGGWLGFGSIDWAGISFRTVTINGYEYSPPAWVNPLMIKPELHNLYDPSFPYLMDESSKQLLDPDLNAVAPSTQPPLTDAIRTGEIFYEGGNLTGSALNRSDNFGNASKDLNVPTPPYFRVFLAFIFAFSFGGLLGLACDLMHTDRKIQFKKNFGIVLMIAMTFVTIVFVGIIQFVPLVNDRGISFSDLLLLFEVYIIVYALIVGISFNWNYRKILSRMVWILLGIAIMRFSTFFLKTDDPESLYYAIMLNRASENAQFASLWDKVYSVDVDSTLSQKGPDLSGQVDMGMVTAGLFIWFALMYALFYFKHPLAKKVDKFVSPKRPSSNRHTQMD